MKGIKGAASYFHNLSLLKKVAIAYTLVILVPILVAGVSLYVQYYQSVDRAMDQSAGDTLSQTRNLIHEKTLVAEQISESIIYNAGTLEVLSSAFNGHFLQQYNKDIVQVIQNALAYNTSGIDGISIYTSNETLPESWPVLLQDNNISQNEWFSEFRNGLANQRWIYPDRLIAKEALTAPGERIFRFVKKIYSLNGVELGLISVSMLENTMLADILSTLETSNVVLLADPDNRILDSNGSAWDEQDESIVRNSLEGDRGSIRQGSFIYYYETDPSLGLKTVVKLSIDSFRNQADFNIRMIVLIIGLSLIFFIFIIYIISNLIFRKFRRMVRSINKMVDLGHFHAQIPVSHNDEIGQMAKDINFILQRLNDLIQDVILKERAQKDARFMALQYQMNPHFIYNTIEIFGMRMELQGDYETAEAIADFGKMLRYNMSNQYRMASLRSEIEHTNGYVHIQKLKHPNNIQLSVDISSHLDKHKVIKFLLQPLVENAIKHNMPLYSALNIHIDIHEDSKDQIHISVSDDGKGMPPGTVACMNERFAGHSQEQAEEQDSGGIGLMNINKRIQLFYGEEYRLTVKSDPGVCTRVIMMLPIRSM